MPLFDAYLMVDWSANSAPKMGKDSIWSAEYRREGPQLCRRALENSDTRATACAALSDRLAELVRHGRRVLVGFDFPFGYPSGTARWLKLEGVPWQGMWRLLADGLQDAETNANNRFALAELLNERISGEAFPFWGHPPGQTRRFLGPKKPRRHRQGEPAERRLCECRVPRAQPVWKLAYAGSVGSQVLTGIPRVWQIRCDPRIADVTRIWPFETGLRDERAAQVLLAEVYPSLFPPDELVGVPKDAGQVTATARGLARYDSEEWLAGLLACDPALDDESRAAVASEEAWILGVTGGHAT